MQHLDETLYMRLLPMPANENTCNMKHLLRHTSETDETFETYACNICVYPLQYPDKNTCNIRLKQLKHSKYTLATYVYSHGNICNTRSTLV
jgi:hypothetical protein